MLVAWLVAVTVTPGAAAPDESDTSPVTVASPVWPAAGVASTSPAIAIRLARRTNWNTTRIRASLLSFPGVARNGRRWGLLQKGQVVHRARTGRRAGARELLYSGSDAEGERRRDGRCPGPPARTGIRRGAVRQRKIECCPARKERGGDGIELLAGPLRSGSGAAGDQRRSRVPRGAPTRRNAVQLPA